MAIDDKPNYIIEQKDSVKIIKNSKGVHWEIKTHGDNMDEIFSKIDDAEKRLQLRYVKNETK